jgi:hypothetical protein
MVVAAEDRIFPRQSAEAAEVVLTAFFQQQPGPQARDTAEETVSTAPRLRNVPEVAAVVPDRLVSQG